MKNTIRGILIDPYTKTLSYTDIELNDHGGCLKGLYKAINCDLVELVRLSKDLDLWVDEEGLLKIDEDTKYFHTEGMSNPIAGRGVLLGNKRTKEGIDATDCPYTIDDVLSKITFREFSFNPFY
jgi:hypothetical protein